MNNNIPSEINPTVNGRSVIFSTPWFSLVSKEVDGYQHPHYSIEAQDYVGVIAFTAAHELILVRQFRPAIGRFTLELPSGHVEKNETVEEAAANELREETGYVGDAIEVLRPLASDTGRLGNRVRSTIIRNARKLHPVAEPEIQTVLYDGTLEELLRIPEFENALNVSSLMLAVASGRIEVRRPFRRA